MKISKKLVCQEAKEIKAFIDKNKKLPKYATINNSQFTPPQYAYILAKQISKMSLQTISKITVKNPSNPIGDTLKNVKVMKNDYIDMAQRVTKYIETNKQVPNYVTYKKSRVRFELYTYCFAKILAYFKENNTLPNYCLFNSSDVQNTTSNTTNTNKSTTTSTSNSTKTAKSNTTKSTCTNPYTSKPHLTTTKTGLGQNYGWDCSANAVQQCLYKLSGRVISENTLIKVGGVGTSGVGHQGINTMIAWFNKKYNTNYQVQWKNFSDLGKTRDERFQALAKLICKPNIAVLTHIGYGNSGNSPITSSTKIFGHYEVIDKINTKTKYVRALNSLGNKINSNAYAGHLQDRTYQTQASFFANTPYNQQALCIITKK